MLSSSLFQKFHHSPFSGDANQHRRDMELQRLNAEPRMMLEAEAWSNLNAGESSVDPMLAHQVCFVLFWFVFPHVNCSSLPPAASMGPRGHKTKLGALDAAEESKQNVRGVRHVYPRALRDT